VKIVKKITKISKKDYGLELNLDLYGCDPKVIRSEKKLREYVDKLCREIDMKKYGRALVPHFGHGDPKTAGYSLMQFIETSSIIGHFSELYNSAYLDIFSCKYFDPDKAAEFSQKFFRAKKIRKRVIVRK